MNFRTDIQHLIENRLVGIFPNANKRISIWAETDKYRWKEDESVWKQKRGMTPNEFEAYFDGEFICFMKESDGLNYNLILFLNKIKEMYRLGKIFVNQEMYKVREAEEQAKQEAAKKIEVPKATTPEEKIVLEVLKRTVKKGKKVVEK